MQVPALHLYAVMVFRVGPLYQKPSRIWNHGTVTTG